MGVLARTGAGRARRGASLIFFVLVSLPALLFGAGLAVDVTRIVVASRQVRLTAEEAAIAGSYEFQMNGPRSAGTGQLSTSQAVAVARSTFDRGVSAGATRLARVRRVDVVASPSTVEVRARYDVDDLLLVDLFYSLTGRDRPSTGAYEAVRSSAVCRPGSNPATDGFCTRPDNGS